MNRFTRLFIEEPTQWVDLVFRMPPRHPDARDIYLSGVGLLTASQGLQYIYGTPPSAALLVKLGPVFTLAWGWIWVVSGIAVFSVAFAGHHWPYVDRLAGFGLMMIWWVWAGMYALSALFPPEMSGQRITDLLTAITLFVAGIIISAGVILSIRKTQEIRLRQVAMGQIHRLEVAMAEIIEENECLRREAENTGQGPDE